MGALPFLVLRKFLDEALFQLGRNVFPKQECSAFQYKIPVWGHGGNFLFCQLSREKGVTSGWHVIKLGNEHVAYSHP